jgi:PAS domain S-box-containing protein
MAGQKSLVNVFWASMTLLYMILVSVLAYLWVGGELKARQTEFNQIRKTYVSAQKEAIKTQVRQAIHYIEHKRSLAEQRVRQRVKSRTLEAWETARYIWEKNKDQPRETITKLIHDALFAATWDSGKGYYFVEDMAGTEVVNRNNPGMEGKNILDIRDSKGKYLVRDIIRVANSPVGEGFTTYHWNMPDAPGVLVPKVSYVKHFKPLDWVIGNGKYIIDEEEKIKAEVLAYLEEFRFGKNDYIFAGTFEGISLTGPYKGENKIEIQDSNGVKIVAELIRAARSGGGFVDYVAPKFQDEDPAPKISYAQAVEEWGWYIGAGMHVDDVETLIQKKQAELKKTTNILIAKTVMGLAACLLGSIGLALALSWKIRNNLKLFSSFFKQSATSHTPLADDQISFKEFIPLAGSANWMLKERNAYEAALIASEKKYRRLFEHSKDAILIIENEIFVDCNQATVDLLGYEDKNRLLQTHPSELSPPSQPDGRDSFSKAKEMMDTAIENGSHRFEWDHVKANGEVFPVEVLLTSISTDRGRQILHTTWRDITDRKKAEALMIQTEKMMTIGGLAAGMAHEINNPLAGMMQSAQVIKHRLSGKLPVNEKTAAEVGLSLNALETYAEKRGITHFIDTILETGNRAAKIVQNMLNFVRQESGEKSLHDVGRILDRTIELTLSDYSLKKDADIRKIDIVKNYSSDAPQVLCDESNIQQVFFNLLKNAAQAMADAETQNPRIELSVIPEKNGACILVKDNGPGMDPSVSKRIFEPFYTTKAVDQGTGLGLSVSYFIIVQDHGGGMEVTSLPGEGTVFSIHLPVSVRNPV